MVFVQNSLIKKMSTVMLKKLNVIVTFTNQIRVSFSDLLHLH